MSTAETVGTTIEMPKYPHIARLTDDSPLFLLREVLATEKVDGTNARFGLVNGRFQVGGRNIVFGQNDDAFGFRAWCEDNDVEERVRSANPDTDNIVYFGEWFGPRIQKGIDYGAERRFAGFDVWRHAGNWLDRADAEECFKAIGLPMVPVVWSGPIYGQDISPLRARVTVLGAQKDGNLWEGVVLRPAVTLRDRHGDLLMAKLKNPVFEERRPPKEPSAGPSSVDIDAVRAYCTEERLRHVLTGLRESGVDVTTPSTTGDVIRAYIHDVLREATDLTDAQRSLVGRVVPGEVRRMHFSFMERLVDAMNDGAQLS